MVLVITHLARLGGLPPLEVTRWGIRGLANVLLTGIVVSHPLFPIFSSTACAKSPP